MHKTSTNNHDNAQENKSPEANTVQRQTDNTHQSPQGKKAPYQAKQRPVQRKQGYPAHEAKQQPVQRQADNGNNNNKNNTGLPDQLKTGIEQLSGYSMDDVKVHHNSDKPAQLKAHAYAQGTDIHLAPGQERHLPHEAWHVVQQKQGRVHPTTQLKGKQGVGINDDAGLEREADVMGAKALNATTQNPMNNLNAQGIAQANTVQLEAKEIIKKLAAALGIGIVTAGAIYAMVPVTVTTLLISGGVSAVSSYWSGVVNYLVTSDNPQEVVNEKIEKQQDSDSTPQSKPKKEEPNPPSPKKDEVSSSLPKPKKEELPPVKKEVQEEVQEEIPDLFGLTPSGNRYKNSIKRRGNWGGYIEAQTIANHLSLFTAIYRREGDNLIRMTEIGDAGGTRPGLSLYWEGGTHYVVIRHDGTQARINNWDQAVLFDPRRDGDCLYAALHYISHMSELNADQETENAYAHLLFNSVGNFYQSRVERMRQMAFDHIDTTMANIAGAEQIAGNRDKKDKQLGNLESDLLHAGFLMSALYDLLPYHQWEAVNSDSKGNYKFVKRGEKQGAVVLRNKLVQTLTKSALDKTLSKELSTEIFGKKDKLNTKDSVITLLCSIIVADPNYNEALREEMLDKSSSSKKEESNNDFATPVEFNGVIYKDRDTLINKIMDDHTGNLKSVRRAFNKLEGRDVKSNKGLKRKGPSKSNDPELDNLKQYVHASMGMGENGCSIFFDPDSDPIKIYAIGHHYSSDDDYEIVWGSAGWPSKGKFTF